MRSGKIMLAHGNGGRWMRYLIEEVFSRALGEEAPDTSVDAARVMWKHHNLVVTTDVFTVEPVIFPGGDIGSLAVHGTMNDLAVSGAKPLYITVSFILEEGMAMTTVQQVATGLAASAHACGVKVLAGDTKVVRHGQGGGIYIAVTGFGEDVWGKSLSMHQIKAGDCILVSGPVGDHGTAVMLARADYGLHGQLHSDSASVWPLTKSLLGLDGIRFMRDPTRGGVATVVHEMVATAQLTAHLWEEAIPVRDEVRVVCEVLGYDPLYLASEGRVIAVVAKEMRDIVLAKWQSLPEGKHAACIGYFAEGTARVVITTELGGERLLMELAEEPLPRIC